MALLESDLKRLKKGDKAPDFSLKNIDDKFYSLSDFKDKILLIIFMCNHCPYVKAKMNEIALIQEDYNDKGVVVIGINSNDTENFPDDDFEHMKKLAEDKGYKFYLLDESQDIARKYGASCTPDPFVFDNKHRLVYHGRINDAMSPGDKVSKNDIREILDKLISGDEAEIKEWFVPSIGCSIKWK